MSEAGDRQWDVGPLDARSLTLSVLLGSHPPALPTRALVALAELFGIAPGTMRTALSRMVGNGELQLGDGRYHLTGGLLDRQRSQDAARRSPRSEWSGDWHVVVTADPQRDLAQRRRFRAVMVNHRFGELRSDTWLRPANLPPPDPDPGWLRTTGALTGRDPAQVAALLWDLDALRAACDAILTDLDQLDASLDWRNPASIPPIFRTSAAAVRFLRREPALPRTLQPADWPVDALRQRYDDTEQRLQTLLSGFLRGST